MANRYWVGGTATWNDTAGTKWATTSGGTGGASVPTTADDVFFSSGSGAGIVTIGAANTGAKSINCTGFTGTLTGTAAITVAGGITLVSGMTYTHTGTVTMTGTGTLTTAGKTFSALTIDGSGITVTLGSALNVSTRSITLTRGTFATANYNVTAGAIVSSNSNTRTITLGSSTLTLSGATPINFLTSTGLTLTAGTSQITLSGLTPTFNGGGETFFDVSFTGASTGTRTITGANTFESISLTVSGTGLTQLAFEADQTINGTFTCAGPSVISRGFVRSNPIGASRTITVATISANDCDFRDITIAGGAAGTAPTRAGDCGGNSGITFPAAKTVYRVGTDTNWTTAAAWAPTSGGTGASANFPLAQDTAVINNDTTLTGTLSLNGTYNNGTLDASTRTTGITLSFAANTYYGNFTLGSGVTVSGTGTQTFSGRGTQTFTSAGKTITFPVTVNKPAGAFELGDAFVASNTVTLTRGTFDSKNYNVTCPAFASTGTATRTLTMGSGLWTLNGTSTVWNVAATGLTLNKDTANILLSDTSTASRSFDGDGLAYNKLTIGGATGTSTTTIYGLNNTFSELASTKTVAHTIVFAADMNITSWTVTGTAGNVVTVNSWAPPSWITIALANVTSGIDYLSVANIRISAANRFYVGANSTNGGGNLNVYFTVAPILGTLAATDAEDTAAFIGKLVHIGTLAATDAEDIAAFSGSRFSGLVIGTLAATEAADVFVFSGTRLGPYPDPAQVQAGVTFGPGQIYVGTLKRGSTWLRRR